MNISKAFFRLVALVAFVTASTAGLSQTVSRSESSGNYRWRTSTGVTDFNIELRGEIEVTDDDKDIKSMSDDGYLEITKTVFGSRRSIVIESLGGGKLQKKYYEGRTEMKWEPDGRTWLAEILPDIVRNTTVGAESRARRFFRQGGVTAVLNEIRQMRSDYVKHHYGNVLMELAVQPKDFATIVGTLADEIDSDHYLSSFLKKNSEKFLNTREGTTALLSATTKMESDHYKTVVIKDALRSQIASIENVKVILAATGKMDSDHYVTEVLTTLLKQDNLSDALIAEMVAATRKMESDHYKTVILTRAMEKPGLSATAHAKVIESVKEMESDHYITEVINRLLKEKLTDESLTLLLDITSSIESDHYKSQVLTNLLRQQQLSDGAFSKVLGATSDIGSDHYNVLVLKNALSVSSSKENRIVQVLTTARQIDSDHYLTDLLVSASDKVRNGSSTLKETYRATAKSISSETYFGRALRAIE